MCPRHHWCTTMVHTSCQQKNPCWYQLLVMNRPPQPNPPMQTSTRSLTTMPPIPTMESNTRIVTQPSPDIRTLTIWTSLAPVAMYEHISSCLKTTPTLSSIDLLSPSQISSSLSCPIQLKPNYPDFSLLPRKWYHWNRHSSKWDGHNPGVPSKPTTPPQLASQTTQYYPGKPSPWICDSTGYVARYPGTNSTTIRPLDAQAMATAALIITPNFTMSTTVPPMQDKPNLLTKLSIPKLTASVCCYAHNTCTTWSTVRMVCMTYVPHTVALTISEHIHDSIEA